MLKNNIGIVVTLLFISLGLALLILSCSGNKQSAQDIMDAAVDRVLPDSDKIYTNVATFPLDGTKIGDLLLVIYGKDFREDKALVIRGYKSKDFQVFHLEEFESGNARTEIVKFDDFNSDGIYELYIGTVGGTAHLMFGQIWAWDGKQFVWDQKENDRLAEEEPDINYDGEKEFYRKLYRKRAMTPARK